MRTIFVKITIALILAFAIESCKEPYVIVLENKNPATKRTTYCAEQFGTGNSKCWESIEEHKLGDIIHAREIKRHH